MRCIETIAFRDAMDRLADCHADSGVDRNPQSMKLLGVAGVGKSFVFEEYRWRHPPVAEEEVTLTPVVHVKIPTSPTKRDIFAAFLKAIGARVGTGTAAKLRDRVETVYEASKVELVLVDEVQHLIDRGRAQTFALAADALKEILDLLMIPVVYGGAPRSEILFGHNGQLRSRVPETLKLYPFNLSDQFPQYRGFLHQLADPMSESNRRWIAREDVATRMFYATDGVQRATTFLIKRLLRLCNDGQALDFQTLTQVFERHYWPRVPDRMNPFHRSFVMRRLNAVGEIYQPTFLDGDNHQGTEHGAS